jgi:hypothetical protein
MKKALSLWTLCLPLMSALCVAQLNKQDVTGVVTGNSTYQTAYTYTLPGGTLAAGQCLDVYFPVVHLSGSNTLYIDVTFGNFSFGATTTGFANTFMKVCNDNGSTTAQWATFWDYNSSGSGTYASQAVNTNNNVTISAQVYVKAPDTWQGRGFLVATTTGP